MIAEQNMSFIDCIAVTSIVGLCFAFYFRMMLRFFDCVFIKPIQKRTRIVMGVIAYVFMISVTLLQFPLFINWTLVAVLYVIGMLVVYRTPRNLAICMGMQGALVSLTTNVITRTLTALLINQPLAAFDSQIDAAVFNIKHYPIAAAFLLAGALFWLMRKTLIDDSAMKELFEPTHQRLFLAMCISFFAYLDLGLLIYDTDGVESIIKLWCLKSAFCVLFANLLYLSHYHTIAQYLDYALKNNHTRHELETGRRSNAMLETAANCDVLTGCQSRVAGLRALEALFAQHDDFLLCYLDLNELKSVNDRLGHNMGDQYLAAVGHTLCATMKGDAVVCRYGGDEFFVLQPGSDAAALRSGMEEVRQALTACSHSSQYPFALSVSYGIAVRHEAESAAALLALSDQRMYEDKKNKTTQAI